MRGTRAYVKPDGAMYRAARYDAAGNIVSSTGPYSTQGAAAGSRGRPSSRVALVRVEVCVPVWEPVAGTEVEAHHSPIVVEVVDEDEDELDEESA